MTERGSLPAHIRGGDALYGALMRKRLAYHEAGHAVATWLAPQIGLPQIPIERIRADLRGSGPRVVTKPPEPGRCKELMPTMLVDKLSGPLTEFRYLRRPVKFLWGRHPDGQFTDSGWVAYTIDGLVSPKRKVDELFDRIYRLAMKIQHLPQFWPAAESVADALVRKGALTREEFEAIMAENCPVNECAGVPAETFPEFDTPMARDWIAQVEEGIAELPDSRYENVIEYPPRQAWILSDYYSGSELQKLAATMDTDNQILITIPKGSSVKSGQVFIAALPILEQMGPSYLDIGRITWDARASKFGNYVWGYWVQPRLDSSGSVTWTEVVTNFDEPALEGKYDSDELSGVYGHGGVLFIFVECEADDASTSSETSLQIRDLTIYINRTTAPTVDEAAAEIWTDITGSSDVETETIGSPLKGLMVDPFTNGADAIQQVLARATVPPLCGCIHGTFKCLNRPTAPTDNSRLWVVSEQLTPGLSWNVDVDRAQSKDYVALSYRYLDNELLTDPDTNGVDWPASWSRSTTTNCTAYTTGGNYFRLISNATEYTPVAYANSHAVTQGDALEMSASCYLGAYDSGSAQVGIEWRTGAGTVVSCSYVYNRSSADATQDTHRNTFVAPATAAVAVPFMRWTGRSSGAATTSLYARRLSVRTPTTAGTLKRAYYPSTPSALTDRIALIDSGSDLTDAEATESAEQAYAYYHDLYQGSVTIPYLCHNGYGQESPVDHIEAWDWVLNAGKTGPDAGPFLVSEVRHAGGIATLTIGATEGYSYESPYRLPTKGRYAGAHRQRHKLLYGKWYRRELKKDWKRYLKSTKAGHRQWKSYAAYAKAHPMPKRHPRYKVWYTDVAAQYV
jgi:hypothetical protein